MTEANTPEVDLVDAFYPNDAEAELEESTEEAEIVGELPEEELEDEASAESEESEAVESDEDQSEQPDDSELFVTLAEGDEASLKEIKEWKQGYLRQSDYTRKRQADAEAKRTWEADKQGEINTAVSAKLEGFDDAIAAVEAIIQETDDSIDWEELREYDSGEFIKQTELKDKRLKAVSEAKALRQEQTKAPVMSDEDVQREQSVLTSTNNWLDDKGEPTAQHKQDLELLSKFLVDKGYTAEEQNRIVTARDWQTLLDAARYGQAQEKVKSVKKKVVKLPITSRPKKGSAKPVKDDTELFYGKSNKGV